MTKGWIQPIEIPIHVKADLKTAELIGMYLYADALLAADIIYDKIDSPTGFM